jgi:hypothetical protein
MMRTIVSVMVLASSLARAADPPRPRHNGIQADLSLGVIGVAYERVVHDRVLVHAAAQYYRPWYTGEPVWGFGAELRAVIFVYHQPAPRGLYVSPFVRGAWASSDGPGGTGDGYSWAVGVTTGYSLLIKGWFNLRLGPGIQYFELDVQEGPIRRRVATVYPALDIMVTFFF